MEQKFTLKDYKMVDSLSKKAIETGEFDMMWELQSLKSKIANVLVSQGQGDELFEYLDRELKKLARD